MTPIPCYICRHLRSQSQSQPSSLSGALKATPTKPQIQTHSFLHTLFLNKPRSPSPCRSHRRLASAPATRSSGPWATSPPIPKQASWCPAPATAAPAMPRAMRPPQCNLHLRRQLLATVVVLLVWSLLLADLMLTTPRQSTPPRRPQLHGERGSLGAP